MSSDEVKDIVAIMKTNCLHAYLATVDGDQPYVRPVSPIVEDGLSIWVTTFGQAKKVQHIKQNPRVCLAFVSQPNGDQASFVYGRTEMVQDLDTRKRIWGLATFDLLQHFPGGPESEVFSVMRIIPEKIVWRASWDETKTYTP